MFIYKVTVKLPCFTDLIIAPIISGPRVSTLICSTAWIGECLCCRDHSFPGTVTTAQGHRSAHSFVSVSEGISTCRFLFSSFLVLRVFSSHWLVVWIIILENSFNKKQHEFLCKFKCLFKN